jgi:DSP-PTPase phosphatase fused to NAD+ Kinase
MKSSLIQLSLVLAVAFGIAAQSKSNPRDAQHSHPAPDTSIVRFGEIDEGVYKGSKPKTDADYRFLKSKNIKYILDLKFFPLLYKLEEKKAKKFGMVVIPATIHASPLPPSKERVRRILRVLADRKLRPIYFHCSVGRDRTSLIATLYEIYFKDLPPEYAMTEMKRLGFKDDWTLHGLKKFLQDYSSSPLLDPSTQCRAPLPLPPEKVLQP